MTNGPIKRSKSHLSIQEAAKKVRATDKELADANEATRKRTRKNIDRYERAVHSSRSAKKALDEANKRGAGRSSSKKYPNQK
jgi:hypothetical protein